MNGDLTGLAFAAGMVAAFNPCGFAMLPAYLTLVVRREDGGQLAAMGRAVVATVAMTLGFLTVFGAFGLLTVSVASTVQRYAPYVTVVVGACLVLLGVWLLTGRELAMRSMGDGARWAPTNRLWSMFGYGIGYAIASLSCTIGPFLAVTGSSARSGSALGAVGVYAAYAAGFGLVVGVLAVAVAAASSAVVDRMRRMLPFVNRISGAILLAVGLYVAYYGWFELRLFSGTGGQASEDPVIAAAAKVQRALAGFTYAHGVWPWLIALGVVLAMVAAVRRRRRRRIAAGALTVLCLSTAPAVVLPTGTAAADVCASAGRRVTVSGCADLSDVMAPYVVPPDAYAPITPDASACVGWNGRWINASGCT